MVGSLNVKYVAAIALAVCIGGSARAQSEVPAIAGALMFQQLLTADRTCAKTHPDDPSCGTDLSRRRSCKLVLDRLRKASRDGDVAARRELVAVARRNECGMPKLETEE